MAIPGKARRVVTPAFTLPLHEPPDGVRDLWEVISPPLQLVLLQVHINLLHLLQVTQQGHAFRP